MSWNATHNQLFCIAWPPIIIHLKKKGHSQVMQNQPSFLHKKMGKLLVMERVKVAPPKAMEMRIKVKYTSVYHTELCFYRRFGFPSQCSKMKNYPQLLFIGLAATKGGKISEAPEYWGGVGGLEAQELRKRPRHQPVQKLLIGLIADSTTNEHYNFQLDVGM
ncbi:hypothetical protein DVH24_001446 [Malus domestica]|uniref:Uncharacterized protein n=1 Tax=Malus domestica TaxID=3750 RepID=A0A498K793_MALDO|nr:hypothetical protein DVH24_001446 [Malus domestica]